MRKILLLAMVWISLAHLSCSLNPLNGFLDNINVQIISVGGPSAKAAQKPAQVHANAVVPVDVPTQAADFDCVAFSVTGYGIDEKEDVAASEVPIASLRLGMESPMQDPAITPGLTFNVQIPSLLGVDPRLQKRLVQVLGVYTSLADKTSCRGKNLSAFLTSEDPYAAVYVVGSSYYPTETSSGSCTAGSLCITDDVAHSGAGTELVYAGLFQDKIYPEAIFTSGNDLAGPTIFSDSDLTFGRGQQQPGNSSLYESKPSLDNHVARIDLYYKVSEFVHKRAGSTVRLELGNISAPEYGVSGGFCNSPPLGSYSNIRFKIWDGLNQVWMDPPRNNSAGNLDISPASPLNGLGYDINFLQLGDSNVHGQLISGKEYVIVSVRSLSSNCSSVKTGLPALNFL